MSPAAKGGSRIPASKSGAKATSTRAVGTKQKAKGTQDNQKEPSVTTAKSPSPSKPTKTTDADTPRAGPERHSFGARRLDDLLGGGIQRKSSVLLYGPPYTGKAHLARMAVAEAVRNKVPVLLIHTDRTVADEVERLSNLEPTTVDAVKEGRLHFVDCYSRGIEADESNGAHVQYMDGPMDLNGIGVAVNAVQRKLQSKHDTHLLVLDSLSTIIQYTDSATTFRFLQILLGKGDLMGASSIAVLGEGMHSAAEVQTFRHLTTGAIELQEQSGKHQLRVQGISKQEGLGWIDYSYHDGRFDLTGSFAPGRIR